MADPGAYGPPAPSGGRNFPAVIGAAGRYMVGHPVLTAAGAAATIGAGEGLLRRYGTGAASSATGMGSYHRGFHIERRGKHAGQLIRNRRMNVCNPRALRRAIRRAHGFTKLAMRTIHLVHPKKKASFGGFRKKRRRA
jgi:hypothetical protein